MSGFTVERQAMAQQALLEKLFFHVKVQQEDVFIFDNSPNLDDAKNILFPKQIAAFSGGVLLVEPSKSTKLPDDIKNFINNRKYGKSTGKLIPFEE